MICSLLFIPLNQHFSELDFLVLFFHQVETLELAGVIDKWMPPRKLGSAAEVGALGVAQAGLDWQWYKLQEEEHYCH